jgi:hypothetical protein
MVLPTINGEVLTCSRNAAIAEISRRHNFRRQRPANPGRDRNPTILAVQILQPALKKESKK